MGRRKGLRRTSVKQHQRNSFYRRVRDEWFENLRRREAAFCWFCGPRATYIECEHMLHGRSKHPEVVHSPSTFFAICRHCHSNVGAAIEELRGGQLSSLGVLSRNLATMLRLKAYCDPHNFDQKHVLHLYGYANTMIDLEDLEGCPLPAWASFHQFRCDWCMVMSPTTIHDLTDSISQPGFDVSVGRLCQECKPLLEKDCKEMSVSDLSEWSPWERETKPAVERATGFE